MSAPRTNFVIGSRIGSAAALLATCTSGTAWAQSLPAGMGPAEYQSAYNLPASGGNGRTVALYLSGGADPSGAEGDLGVYRSTYGLSDCTTANGCITRVNEHGGTMLPTATADIGITDDLLEGVSMVCPDCELLLIEDTGTGSISHYASVMQTALSAGAAVLVFPSDGLFSQGSAECNMSAYNAITGMAIVSDSAYTFPATCDGVVAITNTDINEASSSRGWEDLIIDGQLQTCGGCASPVPRPSWQPPSDSCNGRQMYDVVVGVGGTVGSSPGIAVYYSGSWFTTTGGSTHSDAIMGGILAVTGVANGHFSPAFLYQAANTQGAYYGVDTDDDGGCASTGGIPGGLGAINGRVFASLTPPSETIPPPPVILNPACAFQDSNAEQSCASCDFAVDSCGNCNVTCIACVAQDGGLNISNLVLPCNGTISNFDGQLVCVFEDGGTASPDAGCTPVSSGDDAGVSDPDGGGGGGRDGGSSGHDGGGSGGGKLDASSPVKDAGSSASSSSGGSSSSSGDTPVTLPTSSSGCGCVLVPASPVGPWASVFGCAFALVGARRRRRASRSHTRCRIVGRA
jgi:hypothetical protein